MRLIQKKHFHGSKLMSIATALAIAVFTIALISPAGAQQEATPEIQGGRDGNYFEEKCGDGRVLVGLRGNAGVLIDSVQAICARVDEAGAISDPQSAGPPHGGTGGSGQQSYCPPGRAISAVHPERNETRELLGRISFNCLELANPNQGGQNEVRYGGTGHLRDYDSPNFDALGHSAYNTDFETKWWNCPGGQFAVGIKGRSSDFLNAFGIVCGTPVAAKVDTAFSNLIGQEVSFQASNYLDRFIRHRFSLGYAEPVSGDLGRADSTFRVVPGLAGKCISLESQNYPNQFLRHQGWRIKLAPREESELYKNDATFCMVPGLASSSGVSLESASNPQHFIRHRGGELWLDRFDGSDLNRADATFNVTNPGGATIVR